MNGFFGTYGSPVQWDLRQYDHLLVRHMESLNLHVEQRTLHKFVSHKPCLNTPQYTYAIEGVLFDSSTDLIALYEQYGETFMRQLRGTFSGFFYDKKRDLLLVFTDQIGSKMLFWYQNTESVYFSSDLLVLSKTCHLSEPDEEFMDEILRDGYSRSGLTMIKGTNRLLPGECLRIEKGQVKVCRYFRFSNHPVRASRQERLQKIDYLFHQAVRRAVKCNEGEGLSHFFPLSGGLDSRMTQWIASIEAKQPIVNFTYSQEGHYDHLVPEQIAKYLHHEWVFESLNGGDYLTHIDDVVTQTNMLLNYNGPSEIAEFVRSHSWDKVGIVLTGVNGDDILSAQVAHKRETDRLYSLSLNGNMLGSPLILQHVTESYSPFMDVDFLEYVMHIPTWMRRNYRLYDEWITTYYPEAAKWHHKFVQIGHRPVMVMVCGRYLPLSTLPKRMWQWVLKHVFGLDTYVLKEGESMNPYDSWYKENQTLREQLDTYFRTHIAVLNNHPAILKRADDLYQKGAVYDKCKVLTLLSSLSLLARIDE